MMRLRTAATARRAAVSMMIITICCAPISGVPVARRQLPPLSSWAPAGEGLGAARTIRHPAGPVDPAALEYGAQHSTKPSQLEASGGASLPAASQELQVVVPEGVAPGGKLLVKAPDGQSLQVIVPPATLPGQIVLVHVPPTTLTTPSSVPSRFAATPVSTLPSTPDKVSLIPAPSQSPAPLPQASEIGTSATLPGSIPRTVTILNKDVSNLTPDTEDAAGWVPVPCPAGHENLDCTVPTMKTWELHTSNDGTMLSGIWEATPGTYHATFKAYEFVHMIYGRIVITPDNGSQSFTVQGGDTFVVEADFKGLWKIEQAVRK